MGVAAFTWVSASDTETYNFPYPMNRLGWADASGKLSIWVNGGWGVDLGNGESLPLRFQFSSMQDRISDGILGMGWWIPLLESTVVQQGENQIRLTALGGQSIYLFVDHEKSGRFVSGDRLWSGQIKGAGSFDVEGPGGWSYSYRRGRIDSASPSSGSGIIWKYDDRESPIAIVGENNRNLISVVRGKARNIEKIQLNDGVSRLEFLIAEGEYPLLNSLGNFETILGVKKLLLEFQSKMRMSSY